MELEYGHTNYRTYSDVDYSKASADTDVELLTELGPGGKAGVKTSSFTPVPAGLNSSPEDLAKYQALADNDHGDSDNVVSWHCDAYPFVCVLMLSDVTEMIGGETALQVSFNFFVLPPHLCLIFDHFANFNSLSSVVWRRKNR